MCGIAGFTTKYTGIAPDNARNVLSAMTGAMFLRGPDDAGTWIDADNGIYLGHRRLAVIDLTQTGAQPQISHSGRYIMTYNGEVYNHNELRQKLSHIRFNGTSDTETILACFDEYGIEDSLRLFNGPFAFGVFDKKENRFILSRDRLGEKPLYYGRIGDSFVFASELRAFHEFPGFKKEIDKDSLALFFRYGYIPAPYSIYKDIFKLMPGYWLDTGNEKQIQYWNYFDYRKQIDCAPNEAVETVEKLLTKSVSRQMLADVPVGAFLSGGVDSSLVAAIMQSISSVPVNTYTIGFRELGFDEAPFAKAVANHLGTNHTELYLSAKDALDVIPDLPNIYDEPFSDSSQIPMHLVCKLARQNVSVALSGDAGDEIFGGYGSYKAVMRNWSRLDKIPHGLRRFAGNTILGVPSSLWDKLSGLSKGRLSGFKLHRGARSMLLPNNFWDVCHEIRSVGNSSLAIGAKTLRTIWDSPELFNGMDMLGKMMTADTLMTLPYDMLVKTDKAAMGCSLETRVPILDIPLVEYAARLPSDLKIRDGQTKWILRQILYKHVPRELIERPKSGFSIPVGAWLRGELKDWADELLNIGRLNREGYVDANHVNRMWQAHASGKADYSWSLWSVLMFQAWLERWK